MPTRREMLMLAGALLAGPAAAAGAQPVRVGVLQFGTVSWEIETIRRQGFDAARGLEVQPVRLASSDAARIAFQAGAVDAIVSDLLLAARLRAEGRAILYAPFSATEGAVMVPAASPIRGVADLAGRSIGVAGGALDKSWLLLQAHARRAAGIDLAGAARPAYGAPPLLTEKLETGELDAALLYWNFCARLEAKGFRRLIGADELARGFGVTGPLALVGYVFAEPFVAGRPAALAAFLAASRQAKALLAGADAGADAAWTAIRPLMQAEDEAAFQALRRRFVEGIPHRPIAAEQADAQRLYAVLAEIGGEKLVGSARSLPPGLYADAG
ncbi:ABC transporter substrate-binding protein [Labrys wisconsinensis]|uniref:NitT/TauT family transport system substrate-binding protein n=1 Tax=Labrys wisconsinensis TaxID=425677 RepID=A0ABU0IYQ8_9HYPH|nr:ABC transporter substrate-binding protein [Labrys wisconsinensis]MDQ0467142.1 NitT/TauT family transport system substrate-binding protein [Labrys wisconsinensis]